MIVGFGGVPNAPTQQLLAEDASLRYDFFTFNLEVKIESG